MKALIETDIIKFKLNSPKNETMKNLFYWLDKLEIKKVANADAVGLLDLAHDFEIMSTVEPTKVFIETLIKPGVTVDEKAADANLYAVFSKELTAFITEDMRTLENAFELGLGDRVININRFVTGALYKHPELIRYKTLAVESAKFKDCDVNDPFFDNFKEDYEGFEEWFKSKAEKDVYVCKGDNTAYLGFLFLKPEDEKEKYDDITPMFAPKRRLKVGTFKVESSGFRLGERFIQIIFDHAQKYGVDEIYVTLFKERNSVQRLYALLKRWGFVEHGIKTHKNGRKETVMVKRIEYNERRDVQSNFPAVQYKKRKLFLPILAKWHSRLIPDAERRNNDLIENEACRYALEKVYITTATHNQVNNGDLVVVYRMGEGASKAYSSMTTAVAVIKEIRQNFASKEEFMSECQNRSVFAMEDLERLWKQYGRTLGVVRFIVLRAFERKSPLLKWLWDSGIIAGGSGPRPFSEMQDAEFDAILKEAEITDIRWF